MKYSTSQLFHHKNQFRNLHGGDQKGPETAWSQIEEITVYTVLWRAKVKNSSIDAGRKIFMKM